MKKIREILTVLCLSLAFCCYGDDNCQDAQSKLIVFKKDNLFYVRSYLSQEKDVLIIMNKGRNGQVNFYNTRLIPGSLSSSDTLFQGGVVVHGCGDDTTPWNLNGTYIGGNHGYYGGLELVISKHGLTIADIGSEWMDNSGNKFYIIKLAGPDTIWVLSESMGKDGRWQFNKKIAGNELKCSSTEKNLKIEENKIIQIRPAIRIKEQRYLVDGKESLQEAIQTPCKFFDVEEEYDIISPNSLLDMIRKNPGKEPDFAAKSLESVMTVHTLYRFMPLGACTIEHRNKVNKNIDFAHALFVMTAPLYKGAYDTREYYIPKTLPFEKEGYKYDFRGIQDFSQKLPFPIYFNEKEKNIEYGNNYPDRFIQFLGEKQNDKIIRTVGFAIGYSLIEGLSRPEERARNVSQPIWINNKTSKTYPFAMDQKMGTSLSAAAEFHCLVYRQYFNPAAFSMATSVYWHREAGAYVLYIDYHKPVEKDTIRLPDYLTGKRIIVVEKTQSLNLLTENTVPPEGLSISVSGRDGYIVLKLE